MSVSSPLAAMPSFDNTGMNQASLTRLQQVIGLLDSSLRLPDNPRSFMVYCLGLVIVFAGAFMHVTISAQIMQAEFTLSQLQGEYLAIEQQNGDIIFQIARDTNMARLQERVIQGGYVPVQEREYVFVPSETTDTIANLAAPTENSSMAVAPEAVAATTQPPVASLPATNTYGGQFAQWEAFWSNLMRGGGGASGPATIASAPISNNGVASSNTAANSQLSKSTTNFWSVWWKQASAQGEKLLEQFSGQ